MRHTLKVGYKLRVLMGVKLCRKALLRGAIRPT